MTNLATFTEVEFASKDEFKTSLPALERKTSPADHELEAPPVVAVKISDSVRPVNVKTSGELLQILGGPHTSDVHWRSAWSELNARDDSDESTDTFVVGGQLFLLSFILVVLVKILFFNGPVEPAAENQISSAKSEFYRCIIL